MTQNEVIKKVFVLLEEVSPFTDPDSFLVENENVKPIKSYIESSIDESCNYVLGILPIYMIDFNVVDITDSVDIQVVDKVGYVTKPTDFIRVHSIKMSEWSKVVNDAMSSQSPYYDLQRNPYTRGKTDKPIVAINDNKIELYSVIRDTGVDVFKYVQRVQAITTQDTFDQDETPYIDDTIAEYCALQCAIRVCEVFDMNDKAKILSEEFTKLLQSKML